MRAILAPLVAAMRGSVPWPVRVGDVGCGTGYVLRWLARFGALGQDVEVIGASFNRDLVGAAARLAAVGRGHPRLERAAAPSPDMAAPRDRAPHALAPSAI